MTGPLALLGGPGRTARHVTRGAAAHALTVTDTVPPDGPLAGTIVIPPAVDALALVDEALAAGAGRAPIILVSSFAVGHGERHALNDGRAQRAHAEQRLRDASDRYAIVRPTWLVDDPPLRRTVVLSQDPETDGLVARADLAELCLHALQATDRLTFSVLGIPGPPSDLPAALAQLRPDPL